MKAPVDDFSDEEMSKNMKHRGENYQVPLIDWLLILEFLDDYHNMK